MSRDIYDITQGPMPYARPAAPADSGALKAPLAIADFNNSFSFSGGGIRTYHMRKLEHFSKRTDVRYSLVVPSDKDKVEHVGNARLFHVKAGTIPGARNYRISLNPFKIEKVLKQINPDLVEVGGPYVDPLLLRWATRNLDTVLTGFWHAHYPDAYFEYYGNRVSPFLGKMLKNAGWHMARKTYGFYDATFVAADSIIETLHDKGIERIIQCPLGTDTEAFHPKHFDMELRKQVGAEKRPLVFFPHRLLQEKGIQYVAEAVPAIAAQVPAVFAFAGTGPEYPIVKDLVARRDDCHYLGFIDSPELMAKWYASSDLTYGLSAWETFGLSVIEAMASGLPIIAANEGAARDWVERARCGKVVERNTEQVISASIEMLNRPDLKTIGRRGRKYVVRHFSWEATFDRMEGYYRKLVQARSDGKSMTNYPYMLEKADDNTEATQSTSDDLLANITPMSARRMFGRR